MPFKKGQSGNPKGQPKGAKLPGRPQNCVREVCKDLINNFKLLPRLAELASGQHESKPGDQVHATSTLLDRAYGKPEQPTIELTNVQPRHTPEELERALGEIGEVLSDLKKRIGMDAGK